MCILDLEEIRELLTIHGYDVKPKDKNGDYVVFRDKNHPKYKFKKLDEILNWIY